MNENFLHVSRRYSMSHKTISTEGKPKDPDITIELYRLHVNAINTVFG